MKTMVKEVVSFRLSDEELKLLDSLAQQFKVPRSQVLRKIIMLVAKNMSMKEELEEELRHLLVKKLEKEALREIREEGKRLLSKATWRVRCIKFYSELIKSGVKWEEFQPTFTSWINEAKLHNIDERTVRETIEKIAMIYYRTRHDIDLNAGINYVVNNFVREVYGGVSEEKVGETLQNSNL